MISRRTFVIITSESIIYYSVAEYEMNRSRAFSASLNVPLLLYSRYPVSFLADKKGEFNFQSFVQLCYPCIVCIVSCTHVPCTFVQERFLQWQATFQAKTLIIVASIQTPYYCISQFSSNFFLLSFWGNQIFLYTFRAPHRVLGCVKS